MKQRILFIVNPISGGQVKTFMPSLIDKYIDHEKLDAEIVFTQHVGHATALAKEAVLNGFDILASVGGDGTINEIASVVESTDKKMAIVPCGSGNGLARMLKIPMDNAKALSRINLLNTIRIDTGTFNERKFFNMAGIGFDAQISAAFANHTSRGFKGYVNTVFKEINTYQSVEYEIIADGKTYQRKAFMISIANSSQYGNNAHISPRASLNDGLFDICIIKPFPLLRLPALGYKMFSKAAHRSNYVEIIQASDIKILRKASGPVHIDGEPLIFPEEINIKVKHLSLNLLV